MEDVAGLEARKRKRLKRVLIGAAVFIFIIIPAAAITIILISIRQDKLSRPPRVEVPNVVGQDYRKGESILKEKGLRLQVVAVRFDQNQPLDVIITQNPFAGERVEPNRTITVIIGGKFGQQLPTPEK